MKIRKYSDTEEFRQKPTTPTHDETEQGWPNDGKPTLVCPVIIKELPAVDRHFQGYEEVKQNPIEKIRFRIFRYQFQMVCIHPM